jgi:hypothetical protein
MTEIMIEVPALSYVTIWRRPTTLLVRTPMDQDVDARRRSRTSGPSEARSGGAL